MLDKEILYETKCLECGKEIDIEYIGGQVGQYCTCCSGFFCREHLEYYKNYLHCKKCIYERKRSFKCRPQKILKNGTVEEMFEKGIIWNSKKI